MIQPRLYFLAKQNDTLCYNLLATLSFTRVVMETWKFLCQSNVYNVPFTQCQQDGIKHTVFEGSLYFSTPICSACYCTVYHTSQPLDCGLFWYLYFAVHLSAQEDITSISASSLVFSIYQDWLTAQYIFCNHDHKLMFSNTAFCAKQLPRLFNF